MNQREAISAMRHWACPSVVPKMTLDVIAENQLDGETPFDCVLRVACKGLVPAVPVIQPFDHATVANVASYLMMRLDIENPYNRFQECRV